MLQNVIPFTSSNLLYSYFSKTKSKLTFCIHKITERAAITKEVEKDTLMKTRKALLFLMLTLTIMSISGCANMNQAECETANWRAIGYEDGVAGARDSQFSQHRQECAEHGVTAAINDFLDGHAEGAKKSCTQTTVFLLGLKG